MPRRDAPRLDTLLIANRGEIACRVLHTCRQLGLRTLSVYSDADADATWVRESDLALRLGGAAPRESYLDAAKIVWLARTNGAQAVHPGYGFLSENAAFSEACEAEGLIFLGPSGKVIRLMGDKSEARRQVAQAGIPVLNGYDGPSDNDEVLLGQAQNIGFPLLIKAAAGGGGRGIRRVDNLHTLRTQLQSARREAQNAFGSEALLLERYLSPARHIEVQLFADAHGHVVHGFERECSLQRRHQKLIEETPSPLLSPALRREMGEAAVAIARLIGYRGVGTVEFLVDEQSRFFFLEMNTRLQVEHPITEAVLGLDLVALQIAIGEGQPLPFRQEDLTLNGHAIECRINAEQPQRQFLPSTGTLQRVEFPAEAPPFALGRQGCRVDSGFRQGDVIGPHYDSLLAKLICWGSDRATALRRMQRALEQTVILGVETNRAFLEAVLAHPDVQQGRMHTEWIATALAANEPMASGRVTENLPTGDQLASELLLAAAAVAFATHRFAADAQPPSPWHSRNSASRNGASPWDASWDASANATLAGRLRCQVTLPETLPEAKEAATKEATTKEILPLRIWSRRSEVPLGPDWHPLWVQAAADPVPAAEPVSAAESTPAPAFPVGFSDLPQAIALCAAQADPQSGRGWLDLGEVRLPLAWQTLADDACWLSWRGRQWMLQLHPPSAGDHSRSTTDEESALQASLPGVVLQVDVTEGQRVARDELLLIMEAMKVEYRITAPRDGIVEKIHFQAGAHVQRGDALLQLQA